MSVEQIVSAAQAEAILELEHTPLDQLEAPEPSAGGPMSGEAQLSAAPAGSIQDVKNDGEVLEVQEDELVDPVVIEQKMNELATGEVRLSKWLEELSQEQKSKIIDTHFQHHPEFANFRDYLHYVQTTSWCQGCSKCRLTRCEKCTFSMAQNYVLSHAAVPI